MLRQDRHTSSTTAQNCANLIHTFEYKQYQMKLESFFQSMQTYCYNCYSTMYQQRKDKQFVKSLKSNAQHLFYTQKYQFQTKSTKQKLSFLSFITGILLLLGTSAIIISSVTQTQTQTQNIVNIGSGHNCNGENGDDVLSQHTSCNVQPSAQASANTNRDETEKTNGNTNINRHAQERMLMNDNNSGASAAATTEAAVTDESSSSSSSSPQCSNNKKNSGDNQSCELPSVSSSSSSPSSSSLSPPKRTNIKSRLLNSVHSMPPPDISPVIRSITDADADTNADTDAGTDAGTCADSVADTGKDDDSSCTPRLIRNGNNANDSKNDLPPKKQQNVRRTSPPTNSAGAYNFRDNHGYQALLTSQQSYNKKNNINKGHHHNNNNNNNRQRFSLNPAFPKGFFSRFKSHPEL